MNETVIKVENLYKEYRLGVIGHGTLCRDLQSWWAKTMGKEDPNSLITGGEVKNKNLKENILALDSISFQINRNDLVGIIGRNGAGKSTLLKILSEITSPTRGEIKIKGRIASLLEVGTGFHPDLTGRENIYLNGTILGMRKKEIDKKINDIIAFSEIEKFIDTPAKRYSSGMYVRLAFSVAAHLDAEILIVDEVLAVGDTEFQRKCIKKMEELAREERTILFVSHNMNTINRLCTRGIYLKHGKIELISTTSECIAKYLNEEKSQEKTDNYIFSCTLMSKIHFEEICINDIKIVNNPVIRPEEKIKIVLRGECFEDIEDFKIILSIFKDDIKIMTVHDVIEPQKLKKGRFLSEFEIREYFLRPGDYSISIGGNNKDNWLHGKSNSYFTIAEEYSAKFPREHDGIINISYYGKRSYI